jgi:hypothetical protein
MLWSRVARADDHLRALAGGGKRRRTRRFNFFNFRFFDARFYGAHRILNALDIFLRRKFFQILRARQFNIDADAVGVFSRLINQRLARFGNRFEMDITAKRMFQPEFARDGNDLFHRVIRILNDAGT